MLTERQQGRRPALLIAVAIAAVVMAGCTGGSSGADDDAVDERRAAAQAWADSVACPTTYAELQRTVTRGPAALEQRADTEKQVIPPGDVTAVVRCAPSFPGDFAEDDQSGDRGVARAVVVDEQPLSWFADGDHFRTRSFTTTDTDNTITVVRYADGPAVTVHAQADGGALVQRNGRLVCRTASSQKGTASTTCRRPELGNGVVPVASTPVAPGAPPVDCPTPAQVDAAAATLTTEPLPRPEATETPVPLDEVVVMVTCTNAGARFERWGEQLERHLRPTATRSGIPRCLAIGPPCTQNASVVHHGYTSGPPVVTTTWEDGVGPRVPWLVPSFGAGDGVANGVLACRHDDTQDTSPKVLLGCLPLDVARTATAGTVPTVAVPSASGSPSGG